METLLKMIVSNGTAPEVRCKQIDANTSNLAECVTLENDTTNATAMASTSSSESTLPPIQLNGMNGVFFFIGVFAVVFNIFTVAIIFLYKPMRKQLTNTLIANQCLVDASAGALLSFSMIFQYDGSPMESGNIAAEILCRLWYTTCLMNAMWVSSMYGIVAISFERFLAVVFPLWYKAKLTHRKLAAIMAAVWLSGPLYCIPLAVGTTIIDQYGYCAGFQNFESQAWIYFNAVFGLIYQYILPLVFLGVFYVSMILSLKINFTSPTTPAIINVSSRNTKLNETHIGPENLTSGYGLAGMERSTMITSDEAQAQNLPASSAQFFGAADSSHNEKNSNMKSTKKEDAEQCSSCEAVLTGEIIYPESNHSQAKQSSNLERNATGTCREMDLLTNNDNAVNVIYCRDVGVGSETMTNNQQPIKVTENVSGIRKMSMALTEIAKASAVINNGQAVDVKKRVTLAGQSRGTGARARRNLIKTLITVGVVSLFCWSWTQILIFIANFGYQIDYGGAFFNFTAVAGYLTICINPIIYCIQYQKFQKAIRVLIFRKA